MPPHADRQERRRRPSTGGPALTPEQVGQAISGLVTGPGHGQDAYLITAAGLAR